VALRFPISQPKAAVRGAFLHCLKFEVTSPPAEGLDPNLDPSAGQPLSSVTVKQETVNSIENSKKAHGDTAGKTTNLFSSFDQNESQKTVQQEVERKSTRLGFGVTFRREATSKKGRSPHCKGCGFLINKNESRLVHKFMEKKSILWPSEHSYHCHVECVKKMNKSGLKQFVGKKWAQKEASELVKKLDRTGF